MLDGEQEAHLGHCTLRVIGADVERRHRERARHDDRAFTRGPVRAELVGADPELRHDVGR